MSTFIFDVEATGLDLFDRVLCICAQDVDTGVEYTFIGPDEKKIIEDFFKLTEHSTLVGFNCNSYDVPTLTRRSVFNGVRIPARMDLRDLRKIVNGFQYSYDKFAKGSLRDWAMLLGEKVTTESGSEMFKLYKEGRWDEIKAHCLEDVRVTRRLYDRCKGCGLV